jgi:hypothetical protein
LCNLELLLLARAQVVFLLHGVVLVMQVKGSFFMLEGFAVTLVYK